MKALIPAASAALAAILLAATPAGAQGPAGERINMVIAYSEDECPVAQPGEIVVCEILVEADRYRIPSNLRFSDSPANRSRAAQLDSIKYVGDFGAMSCSPAGAGGFTGCTQKFVEAWAKDKSEAEGVRFGQLIERARQERLSEIDEEAAAEQARVEMIEREYMQRLERERAGELPGESALPDPGAASAAAATPAPAPAAPRPAPVVGPSPDE
ncbi:MAG: hypothetical protein ACK4IS_08170 [Erythrobacter sp.]